MTRRGRITVVGAGVVGLSTAHDLAHDGWEVTVVADVDTLDTVSAIAAALWFPHATEQSDTATHLLARSRVRLDALVDEPSSGVMLRSGTVIERRVDVDRTWMQMTPGTQDVPLAQLPDGAVAGVRASLPVIVTPVYLEWLRARATALGVNFENRRISDVSELSGTADVVVVAAGIRGGELLGDDDSVFPIRGQVVRLANPGLTDWVLDDENPGGITYVIPRVDDVIVGGTSNVNSWDTEVDPQTEAAILDRAEALVPALGGQPVLSHTVGLRPGRLTIRLEVLDSFDVPVVAAYGHGGAGVTLSWGTAERVVELARAISA